MENEDKKPVEKLKIGSVTASIFKNETQYGYRYGVTFCRVYKAGNEWRKSSTFSIEDLLLLSKLADEAHNKVRCLIEENKKLMKGSSEDE